MFDDLSHIMFAGQAATRPQRSGRQVENLSYDPEDGRQVENLSYGPERQPDGFIAWVLGRAGLDAAAYRARPLERRLPACLAAIKVRSAGEGRELLERKPHLVAKAASALLIGVTEFFREPEVFDFLRTRVLPGLAGCRRRLRIWSAACSSGAELYSMAILLSEAGLLEQSCLLGSDCRKDAIDCAQRGLYDVSMLKLVPFATRNKYLKPTGKAGTTNDFAVIEALRRQVRWKVADLLADVEDGPWDIIFWRNAAIYLEPFSAETIWRRLASVLAPQGVLIAGKAERPPRDAGLTHIARCIYRRLP